MIKEISIENFKSIRHLSLALNPINILIGPNGAGKSNFINFFEFVYALSDRQLSNYTAEKGGADRILHLGRKHSTDLSGDLNFDDTDAYGFSLRSTDQNSFFFTDEQSRFRMKVHHPERWEWGTVTHGKGHTESSIHDEVNKTIHAIVKYLQSFRVYHFHDTSKNAPLKQTARLADNQFLRSDGANLASFIYRLKEDASVSYNRIEAVVKQIAPYFDRFDLAPYNAFVRLNWRQKNTDMYLDASDLSDGTLRFIALCTLLLQPNPPRTIIIDEPELGLHPYAIQILAGLIRSVSGKSQVIVSTQSVGLINEFEPEDLIVVENKNNESIFKRLNQEQLDSWLEEYSIGELWNKNVLGGNP